MGCGGFGGEAAAVVGAFSGCGYTFWKTASRVLGRACALRIVSADREARTAYGMFRHHMAIFIQVLYTTTLLCGNPYTAQSFSSKRFYKSPSG